MSDELNKIEARYALRSHKSKLYEGGFMQKIVAEREKVYREFLSQKFPDLSNIKFLEIGAGQGSNIYFFKAMGVLPENIYANELLPDRLIALEKAHPDIVIFPGDASEIKSKFDFDVIFQSTVFTSVLDAGLRMKIAQNCWDLLRPGGVMLWYDFIYNNPSNPDVKKVSLEELKALFPEAKKIEYRKVTLAPPLARRFGFFYELLSFFPFLRTHIVALIEK